MEIDWKKVALALEAMSDVIEEKVAQATDDEHKLNAAMAVSVMLSSMSAALIHGLEEPK